MGDIAFHFPHLDLHMRTKEKRKKEKKKIEKKNWPKFKDLQIVLLHESCA